MQADSFSLAESSNSGTGDPGNVEIRKGEQYLSFRVDRSNLLYFSLILKMEKVLALNLKLF